MGLYLSYLHWRKLQTTSGSEFVTEADAGLSALQRADVARTAAHVHARGYLLSRVRELEASARGNTLSVISALSRRGLRPENMKRVQEATALIVRG